MDKLICVGKNYLDHAKELGDAVPEMPVLFLKPPSTLVVVDSDNATLPYPVDRGELHYECEIVIRLREGGFQMDEQAAQNAIGEATIGLDMTLREEQARLKKNGHPWELGKVFPAAAIIGPWIPAHDVPAALTEDFTLSIDGQLRQQGNAANMRLSIVECIIYASRHFELCAGDLLFTGTPAGVGPILPSQTAIARWQDISYSVNWS